MAAPNCNQSSSKKEESQCSQCQIPQSLLGSQLKHCAKCHTASYCSKDCQAAHWPQHKALCKRQNYILKFCLCPDEITDPPVTRTLSCPASASFADLHEALQIAFGWTGQHSYDFSVLNSECTNYTEDDEIVEMARMLADKGDYCPLVFTGDHNKPSRNVLRIVDYQCICKSSRMIHIDSSFGNMRRTDPRICEVPSSRQKLYQVMDAPEYAGCALEYEYDFDNKWTHTISVVDREVATTHFTCTDGSGKEVAENVGGAEEWENLKEAYHAIDPTQAQKQSMHWYEDHADNGDRDGLKHGREYKWAKGAVNRALRDAGL